MSVQAPFLFLTVIGTWPAGADTWQKVKKLPFGPRTPFLTWIHEDTLIGSRPAIGQKMMPMLGTSRRHARLFERGAQWYLEDLGSREGTWLLQPDEPKQPLIGPTLIFHGMTVLLGISVVRFDVTVTYGGEAMPS